MESDQTALPHNVLFDERQESWYITTDASRRIPLTRDFMHQMVSHFNEIHRGNPLTVMDRKALEELGDERRELHETIWNLYDFIDANATEDEKSTDSTTPSTIPAWRSWLAQAGRLLTGILKR